MDKQVEIPLQDDLQIDLIKIEYDHTFTPEEDRPHRTIFVYRLHIGEGWHDFHVTMNAPYKGFEDLREQADLELFLLLRQLAERARRMAGVHDVAFTSRAEGLV